MNSYMENMPPEIATMICRELDSSCSIEPLKNMRLTNRFWHDVANEHLTEISLIFKKSSFEHCMNIVNHPILSQNIKHLRYIPHLLSEVDTRPDWTVQRIKDARCNIGSQLLLPELETPAATREALDEILDKAMRCEALPELTQQRLDAAWTTYERYLGEQLDLEDRDWASGELCQALRGLPNLREVSMNVGGALWYMDPDEESYKDCLMRAEGCQLELGACEQNHGVHQMQGLVKALHDSETHLNSLSLGLVDWSFLGYRASEYWHERWRRILVPLKTLKFSISTGFDPYDGEPGWSSKDCRESLVDGSLGQLIAMAPDLVKLSIFFDWHLPYWPMKFKHLALGTQWPYLRTVEFTSIDIDEESWLGFCRRHASTLNMMILQTIRLRQGLWVEMLEQMVKVVNLRHMEFHGYLLGSSPEQQWDLDPALGINLEDSTQSTGRSTDTLNDWMVKPSGPCPLRDEEAFPQCGYIDGEEWCGADSSDDDEEEDDDGDDDEDDDADHTGENVEDSIVSDQEN